MTWNYRVIRHMEPDGSEYLAIHEVYYDAGGQPNGVTAEPADIGGESIEEMANVLVMMRKAIHAPIIPMQFFEKQEEHLR